MSNKKLILGIAAGVAALAVVGVIAKRRGYLDNISTGEFGSDLKDKLAAVKENARKKFDDVVSKGTDLADKLTGHGNENGGDTASTSGKNNTGGNSGNSGKANAGGNINPATT
jgi:hypothetical protein